MCGVDQRCRDACRTERDCPADQRCVTGTCADARELDAQGRLPIVTTQAVGVPCGQNGDCASPLVCADAVCRQQCLGDRDCASDETCKASICHPRSVTPPPCVPGRKVACLCEAGAPGAKVCLSDGSAYGPCEGCVSAAGAGGEAGAGGGPVGGSAGEAGVGGAAGQAGGTAGTAGDGGQGGLAGTGGAGGQAGQPSVCGDGVISGAETCDGSVLPSCASLLGPYTEGTVSCGPSCVYDTSECRTRFVVERPVPVPIGGSFHDGFSSDAPPPPLSLGGNGRYAAFTARSFALADLPADPAENVFVADLLGGGFDPGVSSKPATLRQASRPALGELANGDSTGPKLSANGRRVLFGSTATNLVADHVVDDGAHLYVYDLDTDKTVLVDVVGGDPATGTATDTYDFAADGQRVLFFRTEGSPALRRPYLRTLSAPNATRVKLAGDKELEFSAPEAIFCGPNAVVVRQFKAGTDVTGRKAITRIDLGGGADEDVAAEYDRLPDVQLDLDLVGCSADGNTIAYTTNRSEDFSPGNPSSPKRHPSRGIMVLDRVTKQWTPAGVRSYGVTGDESEEEWVGNPQRSAFLSADGNYVLYVSRALPKVVRTDNVYLHDLRNQTTVRLSTLPDFGFPYGNSGRPAIDLGPAPGSRPVVVFMTRAPGVAPGDNDTVGDLVRVEVLP